MDRLLDGAWRMYFYDAAELSIETPTELHKAVTGKKALCAPAGVPGNAELDLAAAGYLPEDLFYAKNILAVQEYETFDFWYETSFCVTNTDGLFLEFGGVDTVADYFLNGARIGRSENMFIPHGFELTGAVKTGENVLHVHIRSAVLEAAKKDYTPFLHALPACYEGLYIRKPAHVYGWDIMPRAVSAGIFKSVRLYTRAQTSFKDVFIYTRSISRDRDEAKIELRYELELSPKLYGKCSLEITGVCGDSAFFARKEVTFCSGSLEITLSRPKLWWVRGLGESSLYRVCLTLKDEQGNILAAHEKNLGVRTLSVEYSEIAGKENNGFFLVKNNGENVMVKGTNWVCADAFHSRDRQKLPEILKLADELNCNLLRMWGGNLYEDDSVFDFCDGHGILVWQDFAFACAVYPDDDAFLKNVTAEAACVIRRLRSRACLLLYCGDNECDVMYLDKGLSPENNTLTRSVLARVVSRYDPFRPFLPSSPYVSPRSAARDCLADLPENHIWGCRDNFKGAFYAHNRSHFISETGYHGCAGLSSIKKFISPQNMWPRDNDEWLLHSTVPDCKKDGLFAYRLPLMADQVKEYFGLVPDSCEDFAFASQVSQAEANKFFVEQVRLKKWEKSGIALWNLYDGWPQLSDSLVDYYFVKKLSYYYTKRCQADVCPVMTEPDGWYCRAVVCNDTLSPVSGRLTVLDGESGCVLKSENFTCAANANKAVIALRVYRSDVKLYLLKLETDTFTAVNHYVSGNPPFDLTRYKAWLRTVAGLDGSFNADEIAR